MVARGAAGGFRRVKGRLRRRSKDEKSEALLSAPRRGSAPGSAMEKFQRRTAGVREALLAVQVASESVKRKGSVCCRAGRS